MAGQGPADLFEPLLEGEGLAEKALAALAAGGWLAPGALAVVEIGKKERIAPPPGFNLQDERSYGAARLVFLGYAGEATDAGQRG